MASSKISFRNDSFSSVNCSVVLSLLDVNGIENQRRNIAVGWGRTYRLMKTSFFQTFLPTVPICVESSVSELALRCGSVRHSTVSVAGGYSFEERYLNDR
ncbi:hypothetical protein AVEN_142779-1 [Araneus ventricosus]|uniref:Uncharacterized protein n=1 Tax=Araneus ventricosus TaxID=182803 RepID=A0A4Y2QTU6_ARAVE|nr:hypothetical protein AVEN_142779-1 [Araneus ventricosus]